MFPSVIVSPSARHDAPPIDDDYDPGQESSHVGTDKLTPELDRESEPVKPPPKKRAKGLSTTSTAIAARGRNDWFRTKESIEDKAERLRAKGVKLDIHEGAAQCARCQHSPYPSISIPLGLTGKNKAIRCLGCTTGKCSFSDPRPQANSFPVTRANFSTLVGIAEDLDAEKHPLGAVQRRILLKMSKEMGISME